MGIAAGNRSRQLRQSLTLTRLALASVIVNVVIVVKINLHTGAQAHVILFSTDLQLAYSKLVKFYSLRFQIEFNFRDAKQYWGLEDFMNVKDGFAAVTNAVNQAFFMVNFSAALLHPYRQRNPDYCFKSFRTASLT